MPSRAQLTELLRADQSVVLDHGLWRRSDRDEWKKTVRAVGKRPLLVYLPASNEALLQRLAARNQRRDAQCLDRHSRSLGRLLRSVQTAYRR
ncbi:AAA family ATPase [Streptomyces sp. NBC_01604]